MHTELHRVTRVQGSRFICILQHVHRQPGMCEGHCHAVPYAQPRSWPCRLSTRHKPSHRWSEYQNTSNPFRSIPYGSPAAGSPPHTDAQVRGRQDFVLDAKLLVDWFIAPAVNRVYLQRAPQLGRRLPNGRQLSGQTVRKAPLLRCGRRQAILASKTSISARQSE